MASVFSLFRTAANALVGYAEVSLGADSSGVERRIPRSVPSDESGNALFTTSNPAHVTLDAALAEIEIKNEAGNPIPTAPQGNAPRKVATGTLAANNASVSLALDGMNTAVVQITGTWVGTVGFLASVDGGASYFPVNLIPYGGGTAVGAASANGVFEMACGGLTHVQAMMSPFTSGSAAVLLVGAAGLKSLRVGAPGANPVPVVGPSAVLTGPTIPLPAGASTKIVSAGERFFRIMNSGLGHVNLGFGAAAVADTGYPIDAASGAGRMGGSLGFDTGLVTQVDIFAISAAGSSVVVMKG